MSGISRLCPPGFDPNIIDRNGLLYSLALTTFGLVRDDEPPVFTRQAPVWPISKSLAIAKIFALPTLGFVHEDGEPRVRFALTVQPEEWTIIAETIFNTADFRPTNAAPDASPNGRFLAPVELVDYAIPRHSGSLYRAFAIAQYDMAFDDDNPGVGLRALPGWHADAIRYIGELFGSAAYFRRIGDFQVLVIEIEHDEEESKVLEQYLSAAGVAP